MHRCLIIEDDTLTAEIARAVLEGSGLFECLMVSQLNAASGLLEQNGIHVIFLDKHLRDAEGFEGLKELLIKYPHIPIVLGTGDTDQAKALRALKLGAQNVLFKPYDLDILPVILEHAMARQHYINKVRDSRGPKRSKVEWVAIFTAVVTIVAAVIRELTRKP